MQVRSTELQDAMLSSKIPHALEAGCVSDPST